MIVVLVVLAVLVVVAVALGSGRLARAADREGARYVIDVLLAERVDLAGEVSIETAASALDVAPDALFRAGVVSCGAHRDGPYVPLRRLWALGYRPRGWDASNGTRRAVANH